MRIRFPFTKKDMAVFGAFCNQRKSDAPQGLRRNFAIVQNHLPDLSEQELKARYDELVDFLCRRIVKMWNERPLNYEYEAIWRVSSLMHFGTDKNDRPWTSDMWDCGDVCEIPNADITRFFNLTEPGNFSDAFKLSEAWKIHYGKQMTINAEIKASFGKASESVKKLVLCTEPTADGDEFFVVEGEEMFDLFSRVSDLALGAADEVNYYGGRKYGLTMNDFDADDFQAGAVISDIVNALLLDGLRVPKLAALKRTLGAKTVRIPKNTMSNSLPKALLV